MNVLLLEDALGIVSAPVGVTAYDFDFGLHFSCTHPYQFPQGTPGILRIGAVQAYEAEYAEKLLWGLKLVNSLEQHVLASELEAWYPHIADLTPRTKIYESLPTADEVESDFSWPVFIKGSRQTSKHNPDLSIVGDRSHYERVRDLYQADPILSWQKPVIREFISLAPAAGQVPGKVRASIEFRSFWWHGQCVGVGRYWHQLREYDTPDVRIGLAMAQTVAKRLKVPFLVVDFAKAASGDWLIIECNDAQEAGYAAVSPQSLWRQILDLATRQRETGANP